MPTANSYYLLKGGNEKEFKYRQRLRKKTLAQLRGTGFVCGADEKRRVEVEKGRRGCEKCRSVEGLGK